MPKMTAMAIAWMRKEDWPRWLAIDSQFQPDYNHWLKRMTAEIERIENAGTLCEKVVIDPDVFVKWCGANGRAVNSTSRATFAAQTLAIRHSASH